jgi:LysM repeat protein
MVSSWVKLGFGALVLFSDLVIAKPGSRKAASPYYQPKNNCPGRCSIAGPNPSDWTFYHTLDKLALCDQSTFYEFSIFDQVDNSNASHRIYSCSSYGPDWTNLPNSTTEIVEGTIINSTYQFGSSNEGGLSPAYVRSLSKQLRQYLSSGYGATNKSVILFARSGKTSLGLYIGKGLQNEGTSSFALKAFEKAVVSTAQGTGTVAMQLCQPGNDGDHVFGIMATSNSTFAPLQNAVQTWSNAKCLSFSNTTNITGPAYITTPLVLNLPPTGNYTATGTNSTSIPVSTSVSVSKRSWAGRIQRRDTCSYIQVASGDGCWSLSQKCGITQAQLSQYNPTDPNFCNDLEPNEYVCCSAGSLPDFAPQPNPDGSCATYTVQSGDYCSAIAAAHSITVADLDTYNTNTWSWPTCESTSLYVGTIICVSTGTPPMPAAVTNAVCGPTVPGTPAPPAGTDVSSLNPCPLNACCDVWGQVSLFTTFQVLGAH